MILVRQTKKLRIILAASLFLGSLGAGATEIPLEERDWSLVTSENFRVHTVLSAERTTEMLRYLEVMRAALDDSSGSATFRAVVPTIIIALDDHADYRQIGAPESTVGIFIADQRENAIIVQDNFRVQGVRTILHEYVHYLHRRHGRVDYPKWFEEGNAEYLSSSRIKDDLFEIGLPINSRLATLTFSKWLPLEQVLNLSDTSALSLEEGDVFYSQSWLLVHYLSSRPDAEQILPESLRYYGELIIAGASAVNAFEKAFSLEIETLGDVLREYLASNDFETRSVDIKSAMPDFAPKVETLSTPKVQLALAEMAMRFGNDKAAEGWFTAALSDAESRPRAEAGLGTVFGRRGEVSKANARFEAGIYLVSYDFRMWMDYAQFWSDRVSMTADAEKRRFYAQRLEEALRSALTISDATPELNSLMGYAYLTQGKDTDEAIEYLVAATEQSPNDQGSRLLLANAYQYAGDYQRAIDAAEFVLRLEHDENAITSSAKEIIDESLKMLNWR